MMGIYEDAGVYLGPDSARRVRRDRGLCRVLAVLEQEPLVERALAILQSHAAYHGRMASRPTQLWSGFHWLRQCECAERHDRIVDWAKRTGRMT